MPPVRAVERALNILACLGEEDLRLVDVALRLKLHKATVTRLLATLARAGMVSRDERDRYSLGPGLILLAGGLLGRYRTLADLLRAPLRRVWETTRETVTIHVRVGSERLCIEELESPETITYRAGIGNRVPLHVGSAGKVLLAFLPEAERATALKELRLVPLTDRTITSRNRLVEELDRVRRAGYAVSSGERIVGATAVSVPVLDPDGRVVAAVSILGPESRLTPEVLKRYAVLLKREIPQLPMVVPHSAVVAGGKG
ncbi:MAG: IclR family transcriptional regulator [Candidatus Rokubacteria bacterium]|nr:IclR family transcriptional regulator [Candidatus Rokubacteria bacterium]